MASTVHVVVETSNLAYQIHLHYSHYLSRLQLHPVGIFPNARVPQQSWQAQCWHWHGAAAA